MSMVMVVAIISSRKVNGRLRMPMSVRPEADDAQVLLLLQDLADALESGKVYAAALDVVSTEPIKPDNVLLKAKNCIITPHMSWGSKSSRQRIMDCTVQNIKSYIEGNPENVVNK